MTSIEAAAFSECTNLTAIKIPISVTSIGDGAFWRCISLKNVNYDGSKGQWDAIEFGTENWLLSVKINYGSDNSGLGDPEQKEDTSDQTIAAKNITKTYGAKPFSLNAKVNTGTALTYVSSDKKVATIDKKGRITIKGCGITNITITAPATDAYNQARKTIELTVKPKKVTLSSVKSTKKKTVAVQWKQDKKASGYLIVCATDSKFKTVKVKK